MRKIIDASSRDQRTPFVADGYERALEGSQEDLAKRRIEIRARIESAYGSQMACAGFLGRLWLRLRIRREIKREMEREIENVAPRDALYLSRWQGGGAE